MSSLTNSVDLKKASKFFSEFFLQLKLCIIILAAVSRNSSVEINIETPKSCLQKYSFKK